jgi:hypothetical protein
MSLGHSPQLITDSLALYLDAENIKSYNGTTTWFDISGLNNHATMYGTVPVTEDVVKYFDFATVTGATAPTASLGFTFASNMVTRTGDFTFSTWVKDMNASVSQSGFFSNSGSGNGFRFGVGKNGIYWLIGPTYREGTINYLSTINDSSWHNVVAVFNRSGLIIDLYLNGVYQRSSVQLYSPQTEFSNVAPGLVRSNCCNPIYTGKISSFSVHNKILSAAEIKQNYDALKARYGR